MLHLALSKLFSLNREFGLEKCLKWEKARKCTVDCFIQDAGNGGLYPLVALEIT